MPGARHHRRRHAEGQRASNPPCRPGDLSQGGNFNNFNQMQENRHALQDKNEAGEREFLV